LANGTGVAAEYAKAAADFDVEHVGDHIVADAAERGDHAVALIGDIGDRAGVVADRAGKGKQEQHAMVEPNGAR
jgi:hypothetical protein